MSVPPGSSRASSLRRAAGFITTRTSGLSPGVVISWSEIWTWKALTPARVPAGARISAGKSGSVARSLPNTALASVKRSPVSCMPSPESPATRMMTRSSSTGSAFGPGSVVRWRSRCAPCGVDVDCSVTVPPRAVTCDGCHVKGSRAGLAHSASPRRAGLVRCRDRSAVPSRHAVRVGRLPHRTGHPEGRRQRRLRQGRPQGRPADRQGPPPADPGPGPAVAGTAAQPGADHDGAPQRRAPAVAPDVRARARGHLPRRGLQLRPRHPPGVDRRTSWPSREASISYGRRDIAVTAELLEGDARDEAWTRALEVWPTFDAYQGRVDRQLRVFRLHPG